MNAPLTLIKIGVLGIVALALEGVNLMSGGDVYLASIGRLAQATPEPAPAPPPPPAPEPIPPPPPPEMPAPSLREPLPLPSPETPPPPPMGEPQQMPGEPMRQIEGQPPQPPFPANDGQPGQFPRGPEPPRNNRFAPPANRIQPLPPRNGERQGPPPADFFDDERDQMPPVFVDEREVKRIRNWTNRFIKEITSFIKRAERQKNNDALGRANAIKEKLQALLARLEGAANDPEELMAVMEDFRDEERDIHEEMEVIRISLELPQIAKREQSAANRLRKTLKLAATKKLDLNLSQIEAFIARRETLISEVKQLIDNREFEDARERMQEIFNPEEGINLDQLIGLISGIRELSSMLKRTGDTATIGIVQQALDEIKGLVSNGDFAAAWKKMEETRRKVFNARRPQPAR